MSYRISAWSNGSSRNSHPANRVLRRGLLLGLTFAAGRLSASSAPASAPTTEKPERLVAAAPASATTTTVRALPAPAPQCPSVSADAAKTAAEHRALMQRRSSDFMRALRLRVDEMQRHTALRPAEAMMGELNDYIRAWTQALGSSPEFVDNVAQEVQAAVCDPNAKDSLPSSMMLYARVMRMVPDVATEEVLDCYFDAVKDEGPALWEGLGAWKNSGLPQPGAIAEIEKRAIKEQTRTLLGDGQLAFDPPKVEVDERGLPVVPADAPRAKPFPFYQGGPATP